MSAQPEPDFTADFDRALLELQIQVGEALCHAAESLALTHRLPEARQCIAEVHRILDKLAPAEAAYPSGPAADLGPGARALRHQLRNVETVLVLLED
ncbi:MAG: hypothetical protein ACLGXA_11285 [Acidobacteriota bacterium]